MINLGNMGSVLREEWVFYHGNPERLVGEGVTGASFLKDGRNLSGQKARGHSSLLWSTEAASAKAQKQKSRVASGGGMGETMEHR